MSQDHSGLALIHPTTAQTKTKVGEISIDEPHWSGSQEIKGTFHISESPFLFYTPCTNF